MRVTRTIALLSALFPTLSAIAQNGNFVPGTGNRLNQVGDDFEDSKWTYNFNNPKSTEENNKQQNQPLGKSSNGRWFEGAKRGQPDVVQRVETPPDGIPGSTGALLLRSLHTGVPKRPSYKMQQEDFIMNVQYRIGGPIPISQNPSVTTRVFLPPTDQWERRSGPQFAFRVALETTKNTPNKYFPLTSKKENEIYWPGLFICMDAKEHTKKNSDRIYFRIRSNGNGGDIMGPEITTTGWWTLGLSVSSNGAVHYYARPGVEDLTVDDYITTQYPYSYRAERFRAAFFNVINADNGRSWSTTWIIDDTHVYTGTGPAQLARRQQTKSNASTTRLAQSAKPSQALQAVRASQSTPKHPPRSQNSQDGIPFSDEVQGQHSNEDLGLELDYFRGDQ